MARGYQMSQVTRNKIYLPSYILIVKTISRTHQSISYQVSPSALRGWGEGGEGGGGSGLDA